MLESGKIKDPFSHLVRLLHYLSARLAPPKEIEIQGIACVQVMMRVTQQKRRLHMMPRVLGRHETVLVGLNVATNGFPLAPAAQKLDATAQQSGLIQLPDPPALKQPPQGAPP